LLEELGMKRRLQLYGIVIIALSVFAVVVMEAPYSWYVGIAGTLFGIFFEVKSLKLVEKTAKL
jgi:hypothetical protein